jgi:hypothetical protein
MRLTATIRPLVQQRAYRLMVAWVTGDRFAMDVVMEEVMDGPIGTPSLLFTVVEFATSLGEQVARTSPTNSAPYFLTPRPKAWVLVGGQRHRDGLARTPSR